MIQKNIGLFSHEGQYGGAMLYLIDAMSHGAGRRPRQFRRFRSRKSLRPPLTGDWTEVELVIYVIVLEPLFNPFCKLPRARGFAAAAPTAAVSVAFEPLSALLPFFR